MASSSSTTPQTKVPTTPIQISVLQDRKKKNEAFVRAYKKENNIKTQAVLPSATMANNEWAIKSGWSMSDATVWRGLCEKAKFATDDVEGDGIICLLKETIEMANHCDAHPVGLIHFARTSHGRPVWDLDTLDYLQANMLPSGATPEQIMDDDDDVTVTTTSGKKRLFQPAQPFEFGDE